MAGRAAAQRREGCTELMTRKHPENQVYTNLDFPGFTGHVGVFVRLFQITQDLRRLIGCGGALDCRTNRCGSIWRSSRVRAFCRWYSL